jgi:AAA15 family ATPase/GTPase
MFPNPKRISFPNHVYSDLEVPLLKQAAIYGANGSGKSNFLQAIKLLQRIVVDKDTLKEFPIYLNKFRLAGDENPDPIRFSIEFLCEKVYFIYNIEFDEGRILKEELYISGLGQKDHDLIYRREESRLISKSANNEQIIKATNALLANNPLSSLLPLIKDFPVFEDERVNTAYNWFNNYLKILSLRRVNPSLIRDLSKRSDLMQFTNKVFEDIGLGIKKIGIEQHKLSDILSDENEELKQVREEISKRLEKGGSFSNMQNDKVVTHFEKDENGEQIAKRLFFTHLGLNGYEADMEIESQSDGTARVLNLIPAFFDIKNRQCVYIIDEIENSIHPSLIINLIKYLSNAETKGQLIFTTHETELLNQQEVMRPDEVWFTEKLNGNTKMYSLNDFKLHNTINIRNGYLEGRYGAIPFIGDLY